MNTKMQESVEVAEFELQELLAIGMIFVVFGIAITYGVTVQSDVRSDINQTTDPEAYTAATDSINATGKLASKQGLIVTVVVAAIIIGILLRYLYVRLFSQ